MADTITIHDIAREVGVSASTVSRVLSGRTKVSASTTARVMKVVDKYDFRPNVLARGLQQQRTNSLAIIMPDVDHPYYAQLFTAAYIEASKHGYTLALYSLHPGETVTESLVNSLIERRHDGVILTGGCVETKDYANMPDLLEKLQKYMPLVSVSTPIPRVSCIYICNDYAQGMRQCVHHLADLGHKRIALLGESHANIHYRNIGTRVENFLHEMHRLSLTPITLHTDAHRPQNGEQAIRTLFAQLDGDKRPTALITINDMMALGAIRELTSMGIRVPEDIAIVGCDNQFFAAYTVPSITTLDLHATEHGCLAAKALARAIDSPGEPYVRIYEPRLIIRESCGANAKR